MFLGVSTFLWLFNIIFCIASILEDARDKSAQFQHFFSFNFQLTFVALNAPESSSALRTL
jgi:hypothetical protein